MYFDKNYIELICSPAILIDVHQNTTYEDAFIRFDESGLRYEFEERAAILQYNGGLSGEDAEKQALNEIEKRIKK